jgi:2-iminobutanoate/2-iminopropanoate deaminase
MELIQTEHAPKAIGPYSQAVASGGFLFTSGQIPMKSDGTLVEGEIEGQTHQVFQNLMATLQAAALNLNDVVKVTLFISNMDDFTRINQVYSEYFVTHKPARTTVEVARLPKDVGLELEAVAKM